MAAVEKQIPAEAVAGLVEAAREALKELRAVGTDEASVAANRLGSAIVKVSPSPYATSPLHAHLLDTFVPRIPSPSGNGTRPSVVSAFHLAGIEEYANTIEARGDGVIADAFREVMEAIGAISSRLDAAGVR